jgi:hypothetical protein
LELDPDFIQIEKSSFMKIILNKLWVERCLSQLCNAEVMELIFSNFLQAI